MISPVLIGGFIAMDRALLYIGQGVILEQEVCWTTSIRNKSYLGGCGQPLKMLSGVKTR